MMKINTIINAQSIRATPEYTNFCRFTSEEAFLIFTQWLIIKWNTKCFGLACKLDLSFRGKFLCLDA